MTNKERHIIVWNNVIKRLKEAAFVTPALVHDAKREAWKRAWPVSKPYCSACIEASKRRKVSNDLSPCLCCPIAKKAKPCTQNKSAWKKCVYAEKNIIQAIKYAIIIRDAWED